MSSRATNRHNKWHSRAFMSPQVKYMIPGMSPSRQCDTCPIMKQGKIFETAIFGVRYLHMMHTHNEGVHNYTFQAVCHFPHNLCL